MFILTGQTEVKITTMYPGKINPNSPLHNRNIKLQETRVVEEVKKWDGELVQHVIETKEGTIHQKNFFQNVFISRAGNKLIDSRSFREPTDGNKPWMFIKQSKFSKEESTTKLSPTVINDLYADMQSQVTNWQAAYRIVCILVSNRQWSNLEECQEEINKHAGLIVFHDNNIDSYVSPLLATFAHYMDDEKNCEMEEDNNDGEEIKEREIQNEEEEEEEESQKMEQ